MSEPDRASAHARLRRDTAAGHAGVDACFPDGLASLPDYRRYLGGMAALLQALATADAQLATHFAPLRAHLDADLRILGWPMRTAQAAMAPAISDAETRLGARYVIEGSALGARLLQRQAAALGCTPDHGAGFLAYHVARGQQAWPQLQSMLAAQDADSPAFLRVTAAARATFALAAGCFA